VCLQKAVFRCFSTKEAFFSGSSFLLESGILASNWHTIDAATYPIYFSNEIDLSVDKFMMQFEAFQAGFVTLNTMNLDRGSEVLFTGFPIKKKLGHKVKKTEICVSRLDAVFGVPGDFDLFDFCLINAELPSVPKVLLIPCVEFIQPNSNIATLSFPGTEILSEELLKTLKPPSNFLDSLQPFSYLKDIFFGFGKKMHQHWYHKCSIWCR
jgi:hypothetical protein